MKPISGALVIAVNVFELNVGDQVYDKDSGKQGKISDIRETQPECVEAFILLDGSIKEIAAYKLPKCVLA